MIGVQNGQRQHVSIFESSELLPRPPKQAVNCWTIDTAPSGHPGLVTIPDGVTGGYPACTTIPQPSAALPRWRFCPADGRKLEAEWIHCPECGIAIGLLAAKYGRLRDTGRDSHWHLTVGCL